MFLLQGFGGSVETHTLCGNEAVRLTPSSLPVDSFVYNLLYEVPLPSPSRSTRLFAGKQNIICYRPGTRQVFVSTP